MYLVVIELMVIFFFSFCDLSFREYFYSRVFKFAISTIAKNAKLSINKVSLSSSIRTVKQCTTMLEGRGEGGEGEGVEGRDLK